MVNSKVFYTADDVAELLTISRPTAYRIIRKLKMNWLKRDSSLSAAEFPKSILTKNSTVNNTNSLYFSERTKSVLKFLRLKISRELL